jgi:uncharacterized membrane protein YoaK (UPF0700 family)
VALGGTLIIRNYILKEGLFMAAGEGFPYKESIRVGMLLAGTAGYIDAYTFAFHDARFASLQSGNLLQLGINIASGDWTRALTFFWPVVGFALGAMLDQAIKKFAGKTTWQWEEYSVLVEAIGVALVAIMEMLHVSGGVVIPTLAIFMAIQADTFGKLRGMPYATVLSTGNIKTFGATLANGLLNYDKSQFIKTRNIGMVMLSFFVAAIISHFAAGFLGGATLLGAPILLLLVWYFVRQDRTAVSD